jgi:hypothetical protein
MAAAAEQHGDASAADEDDFSQGEQLSARDEDVSPQDEQAVWQLGGKFSGLGCAISEG